MVGASFQSANQLFYDSSTKPPLGGSRSFPRRMRRVGLDEEGEESESDHFWLLGLVPSSFLRYPGTGLSITHGHCW